MIYWLAGRDAARIPHRSQRFGKVHDGPVTRNRTIPAVQALIAALLFGASAPFAKLLLGEIEPVLLAALLYLGSGIGLLIMRLFLRGDTASQQEAQVGRSDWSWLLGAVLAGGVGAPIALMMSLRNTPAATASLLLNFEGVATTVIALVAFRESISRRAWWSIGVITLSSVLLSLEPGARWGLSLGALGIIAACVLWGIDNNFTRNICVKDPLTIVTVKGLGAGTFSLAVALVLGHHLPGVGIVLRAMLLGCLSYGVSIVLFIHAMRGLGAARTSALFGTSPLAGVILSLLVFRSMPNGLFWAALVLMAAGALLLVNEQHEHEHLHDMVKHEHAHSHDDGHHDHEHDCHSAGMHSHEHRHEAVRHAHHHMPDLHHWHVHEGE